MSETSPLNIAHLIWRGGLGGIQRVVADLAKAQALAGHSVTVFCAIGSEPIPLTWVSTSVKVRTVGFTRGWYAGPRAFRILATIGKAFDVVHVHFFNPLVLFALNRSDARIVFTEHGNYHGYINPGIRKRLEILLYRKLIPRTTDVQVFNSRYTRSVIESLVGKNQCGCIVHNGTVPPKKSQDEQPICGETLVIGTLGRIVPLKRFELSIEAYNILSESHPCRLLLQGDGSDFERIKHLVTESKFSDEIEFRSGDYDVEKFYACIDVLIVPSVGEAFGLVAIEALMRGKPVLVMEDGGGVAEVVREILPLNVVSDVRQLAARLSEYSCNRDILENDRILISRSIWRFDIARMVKLYDSIYQCKYKHT